MIPPETQYVQAPDGMLIAYQVTGGGDVDLVFMQGAVAHLDLQWEDPRLTRLFERLSAFSRLIRFDRRGMGMSGVLERLPTFEEQGHGRISSLGPLSGSGAAAYSGA